MKLNSVFLIALSLTLAAVYGACTRDPSAPDGAALQGGQAAISDNVSRKNILQTAIGSKDHTTLVAAVKAAELVDVLANPGPFTVFAPTNEAFAKLPAGTVEGLLKPEKKADLQNILQYHVTTSSLRAESFRNGQKIGEANGDSVVVSVKDGKVRINGALIVASIPTTNGMIHVIDAVLLPPAPAK